MERYTNASLGFSLEIPQGWVLLPAPWAKHFLQRAAATSEELARVLEQASAPFLSIHLPQDNPAAAIPTIQCTAKPASILSMVGGVTGVLDLTIPQMQAAFPDLEIVERQDTCIVAGARGAHLKMNMSVKNDAHDSFHCTSDLYVLHNARAVFLLGLSASRDPALRPAAEFQAILRSIRLA